GFWIDMKEAYITLSNEYIESVWWILKQLWDKDLIYQGYKSVPYCPRCGTPLSDHEVALGYKEIEEPSIYIRFPVKDKPNTYFLAWTTTPWTLPGNAALAVHPDVEYVMVEQEHDGEKEYLILAKPLLDKALQGEYRIVKTLSAKELAGKRYHPLYSFVPLEKDTHYVVTADFVNTEEGTGIVHIAPAFGAEDLELGKEYDLPIIQTVDSEGRMVDEVTPWRGLFVKDADPLIIEDLKQRGLLYREELYTHTYPFCWRCGTPLLYYARPTWFIETTRYKDLMVKLNKAINWVPAHIRDGRFGNWLENNIDWALGRERYWGTPLPVWICEECGEKVCIGSFAELRERVEKSGYKWPDPWDPHRPYVDKVFFKCDKCGGLMRRVPEVIDCWFDSGAMPVAQWHYPFENQTTFEDQFPADFICEAVDQTRGWFYSLHAISTMLFESMCYKNVICLGLILDEKGEKMSKSRGNVVDPWSVIKVHGADAVRWYLFTAAPPGQERRFSERLVGEVVRKFILTLWNSYAFFVTYANIDGFNPRESQYVPLEERSPLDRWLLSELNLLVKNTDEALERYDVTGAARPIADFVEDLSNWYIRRSRRRFWKSEADQDKLSAYHTLYETLVTLAKLLAPFTPFIADEIYRNLVLSVDSSAPESVHLCDYPEADESLIDEELMAEVRLAMRLASLGLAARNKARIKVRQPLQKALVKVRSEEEKERFHRIADQLLDELNVKEVQLLDDETKVVSYRFEAVPELLGKRLGKLYPRVREALNELDDPQVARRLLAGLEVELELPEGKVTLSPEEVKVGTEDKPGYATAAEAGYLVAVTTEITPELRQEGLARELVRRIQNMRKEADFRIEDRIYTYYQAEPALAEVFVNFADYIKRETLSLELRNEPPAEGAYVSTFELKVDEGKKEKVTIGVKQVR
ncbi:MAG: isoleucine--tRNA ligase, partial [Chloroflexi bacterium]